MGKNAFNCARHRARLNLSAYPPLKYSQAELLGTKSFTQADGTRKNAFFTLDITAYLGQSSTPLLDASEAVSNLPEVPDQQPAAQAYTSKNGTVIVDTLRLTAR